MQTDWSSLILYISTTVLSAFAGTSAAFYLERSKKEDEEKKKELSAGNRAIFLISQQYNILNTLKNQLIEPYKDNPGAWVNIPAVLPRCHDDLRFDVAALEFLLDSSNPNILGELLVAEQRFLEAIKTVNERSILHRDRLQSQIAALKYERGTYVLPGELEAGLDKEVVGGLKTLTAALIEHVNEGMEGLTNVYRKLADHLSMMFPGKRIIKLKLPEDADQFTDKP
jgi:hypothetical protein